MKAVRVKQLLPRTGEHAVTVMPVRRLPKGFRNNHNLGRLASDVGLALSSSEQQLCHRFSASVRWTGRYQSLPRLNPRRHITLLTTIITCCMGSWILSHPCTNLCRVN